jgi:nicotinate phosphoribosyltransferase
MSGLCTDLYELTMARGYFETGKNPVATFDVLVRSLPKNRSYLLAAGLEQALDFLEALSFSDEDIGYLQSLPAFGEASKDFWDYLRGFRFSGDVRTLPEGTVFFPNEPVLSVTAPLIEGQIAETALVSILNLQSMVATKAERVVRAARGRGVVDFGARRAHGPAAALYTARASYIGGCTGTSYVEAGKRFNIPVIGTMAHSWVLAFPSEQESFRAYADVFPENVVLLIDTYDVRDGARHAARVGKLLKGVRLDSGDLLKDSKTVRRILNRAGLGEAKIIGSGDLNEFKIAKMLNDGAQFDLFGVGTHMVVSMDQPTLATNYKLVEINEAGTPRYRAKFSEAKATLPGRKQVYRFRDARGIFDSDEITLADEPPLDAAEPLLSPVMAKGKRLTASPSLEEIRRRVAEQCKALPENLLELQGKGRYRVTLSRSLRELTRKLKEEARSP